MPLLLVPSKMPLPPVLSKMPLPPTPCMVYCLSVLHCNVVTYITSLSSRTNTMHVYYTERLLSRIIVKTKVPLLFSSSFPFPTIFRLKTSEVVVSYVKALRLLFIANKTMSLPKPNKTFNSMKCSRTEARRSEADKSQFNDTLYCPDAPKTEWWTETMKSIRCSSSVQRCQKMSISNERKSKFVTD